MSLSRHSAQKPRDLLREVIIMKHSFLKILVVFVAVFFITSISPAQENLIQDSGFEQSPHISWGDWKDWGPGERDFDNTEKAYSGTQSYKVTVGKLVCRWNSDVALQEEFTQIQAGGGLEASVYFLIPENNPLSEHVSAYLEIIFYDGEGREAENEVGKLQSQECGRGKPQSQWAKLTIDGFVPEGAKECKLQLVVLPLPYLSDAEEANETYSGVIYFDEVSLIKK